MNISLIFLGVSIILLIAFWFWKINDDFDYLQDKGRYKKDKDGEYGG